MLTVWFIVIFKSLYVYYVKRGLYVYYVKRRVELKIRLTSIRINRTFRILFKIFAQMTKRLKAKI